MRAQFRPAEIVRKFWDGVAHYPRAKLVTFNGRGFDLPLLELAAFRHRCAARDYFQSSRNRYGGNHIDLAVSNSAMREDRLCADWRMASSTCL